jgi:hypothetical protein
LPEAAEPSDAGGVCPFGRHRNCTSAGLRDAATINLAVTPLEELPGMISPASDGLQSLAATSADEVVEIRRILFDALRSLCADLDLHEGDVVHCQAGTASHIWLNTMQGRRVAIERDWARFIQVVQAQPGASDWAQSGGSGVLANA